GAGQAGAYWIERESRRSARCDDLSSRQNEGSRLCRFLRARTSAAPNESGSFSSGLICYRNASEHFPAPSRARNRKRLRVVCALLKSQSLREIGGCNWRIDA